MPIPKQTNILGRSGLRQIIAPAYESPAQDALIPAYIYVQEPGYSNGVNKNKAIRILASSQYSSSYPARRVLNGAYSSDAKTGDVLRYNPVVFGDTAFLGSASPFSGALLRHWWEIDYPEKIRWDSIGISGRQSGESPTSFRLLGTNNDVVIIPPTLSFVNNSATVTCPSTAGLIPGMSVYMLRNSAGLGPNTTYLWPQSEITEILSATQFNVSYPARATGTITGTIQANAYYLECRLWDNVIISNGQSLTNSINYGYKYKIDVHAFFKNYRFEMNGTDDGGGNTGFVFSPYRFL